MNKYFEGERVNMVTDYSFSTLEIACPPTETIHQTKALYLKARKDVLQAASSSALRYLGIGLIPGRIFPEDAYKPPFYRNQKHTPLQNLGVCMDAHQVNV